VQCFLLPVPCQHCGNQKGEVFRVLSGARREAGAENVDDESGYVGAVECVAQCVELAENAAERANVRVPVAALALARHRAEMVRLPDLRPAELECVLKRRVITNAAELEAPSLLEIAVQDVPVVG
jgi:hypothetical protein